VNYRVTGDFDMDPYPNIPYRFLLKIPNSRPEPQPKTVVTATVVVTRLGLQTRLEQLGTGPGGLGTGRLRGREITISSLFNESQMLHAWNIYPLVI